MSRAIPAALVLLVACAGKMEPDVLTSGSCDTAGASAGCIVDGRPGQQTCIRNLMRWSTCAPPGEISLTPQPECTPGDQRACDAGGGAQGEQSCIVGGGGAAVWGACVCTGSCTTYGGGSGGTNTGSSSTPLVLSFANERVEFNVDPSHAFALGRSMSFQADWPTAETPWLALDRNGNGSIDDGSELFGSAVVLDDGRYAENGFEALRELDSNGDGRISASDASWSRLLVWADQDGDRRSSAAELTPLDSHHIVSIELRYSVHPVCDARGNCEVERAEFKYVDANGTLKQGALIDVHLPAQVALGK